MNEERLTVLRMVAEKKISSDEGERLMDALGGETQSPASPKPEQKAGTAESPKKWTFDFGNIKKETRNTTKRSEEPGGVLKSAGFIEEMRSLGFDNLTVEQLVEMKTHGVTSDFVREMRGLGFDNLTPDQLSEMRIHGVTPSFVKEMREQGFENLTPDQLVEMRVHGVN